MQSAWWTRSARKASGTGSDLESGRWRLMKAVQAASTWGRIRSPSVSARRRGMKAPPFISWSYRSRPLLKRWGVLSKKGRPRRTLKEARDSARGFQGLDPSGA